MLFWLAQTCKATREASGENQALVAGLAQVNVRTVDRFERALTWPQASKFDSVLAAYAYVGGLDDVRDLWQAALELWYEHGSKPIVSRREDGRIERTTGDQQKVIERIRQQAERSRQADRAEPARESTASSKRRAKRA